MDLSTYYFENSNLGGGLKTITKYKQNQVIDIGYKPKRILYIAFSEVGYISGILDTDLSVDRGLWANGVGQGGSTSSSNITLTENGFIINSGYAYGYGSNTIYYYCEK